MNSKLKIALIALAAIIVIALGVIVISALTGGEEPPAESEAPQSAAPAATETPAPETEPAEPTVGPAGTNVTTATLAVGGDVVMHTGLNGEALSGGSYNYTPIFGVLPDLVAEADYAVCTLVTSLPGAGQEYTAYPVFRSPDSIASSIASAGFKLVNLATSHIADSYKTGIDRTLDVVDAAGLAHTGAYRSAEERESAGNRTMVNINGIDVAFLAYTCDTNGVPVSGFDYAVSVCAGNYLDGGTEIDYELMDGEIAAAREAGADIVFVFMSWGEELSTEPTALQYEIADNLIAAGADIIIGGHCRVPQPMETRSVALEDGSERSGFVCYSLGNLLSCQNDEYTDISAMLSIELSLDNDSGEARVASVSYRPIYMADLYDYGVNDFDWHYRVVDLHAAISAWESGNGWDFMTEEIYTDMVAALNAAHDFFGPELDPQSGYAAEE